MTAPSETIAVVRRHDDVTEVFRMMKERLGLTNVFIDDTGKFKEGWTDKVLGPSEAKNWGPKTFDAFCEIFAIEFHVRVNMHAVKRMADIWEGRKRAIEIGENSRISKKLIEKAKPHVFKACGALGAAKRNALLTPEQRMKIAKKATRKSSRSKRLPADRRSEIARNAAQVRWHKPVIIDVSDAPADQGAAG